MENLGKVRANLLKKIRRNKQKMKFLKKILEKYFLKKIGNAGFRSETALRNADSGTVKNCVT